MTHAIEKSSVKIVVLFGKSQTIREGGAENHGSYSHYKIAGLPKDEIAPFAKPASSSRFFLCPYIGRRKTGQEEAS